MNKKYSLYIEISKRRIKHNGPTFLKSFTEGTVFLDGGRSIGCSKEYKLTKAMIVVEELLLQKNNNNNNNIGFFFVC